MAHELHPQPAPGADQWQSHAELQSARSRNRAALDRYLESIDLSDALPLPLSNVAQRTGYRAEHLAWLVPPAKRKRSGDAEANR